jgi:hypothetical protein
VRSADPVERNFDRAGAVVDCTREVVVSVGEIVRPFEGGALSPPEGSTTISMRSTTISIWSGDLIGGVGDHFDGRE